MTKLHRLPLLVVSLAALLLGCVVEDTPPDDHFEHGGSALAITEAQCRTALDGLGVNYTYLGDVQETSPDGTLRAVVNAKVTLRNLGPGVTPRVNSARSTTTLNTSCAVAIALVSSVREMSSRGSPITDLYHEGSINVRYVGNSNTVVSAHSTGSAVDVFGIRVAGTEYQVNATTLRTSPTLAAFRDAVVAAFEQVLGPENEPANHYNHFHAERTAGAQVQPADGILRDGDLVRTYDASTVYYLLNGKRFPVLNPETLEALGRTFADVRFVASNVIAPYPVGLTIGGEGSLLKLPTEPGVWKIEGGRRRPFTGSWTEVQFRAATGHGFDAIFNRATPALLARYPEGAPITNGSNPPPPPPPSTELLQNPGFESGGDDIQRYEDNGWFPYAHTSGLGACERRSDGPAAGAAYARCNLFAAATSWWLQLGQHGLAMSNGRVCNVAFSARASSPRTIVAVLQQHQGGTGYGLSMTVSLGTSWTRHQSTFTVSGIAGGSDPDARLTFWVAGGAPGAVDLDEVTLTCP